MRDLVGELLNLRQRDFFCRDDEVQPVVVHDGVLQDGVDAHAGGLGRLAHRPNNAELCEDEVCVFVWVGHERGCELGHSDTGDAKGWNGACTVGARDAHVELGLVVVVQRQVAVDGEGRQRLVLR